MDRFVRCAALTGYPELARSLSLDPLRLMAAQGLDITALAEQDRWIPAAPVARLLEISARESGCEDFGVRLSRYRRFSALGPISVVLREEPDLRSALDVLIDYSEAYNGILQLRLIEDDGLATVQAWLDLGTPAPIRQAMDLTAANLLSSIRALVRSDWEPLSVCFAHGRPAELGVFHEVFGRGLRFDHAFTGVVFPARDLDCATVTADPALRRYTRRLLDDIATPRPASAADRVGSLVELLLPLGRCSMAQVSRNLGMQLRTLHRRLADEGHSFSSIVHATRARLAERYLANDRYSLTEISQLLGFGTPSAFSAWFRQHFGITASEWRQRARSTAHETREAGILGGRG
jgi:AraC-like DNA-binding protein